MNNGRTVTRGLSSAFFRQLESQAVEKSRQRDAELVSRGDLTPQSLMGRHHAAYMMSCTEEGGLEKVFGGHITDLADDLDVSCRNERVSWFGGDVHHAQLSLRFGIKSYSKQVRNVSRIFLVENPRQTMRTAWNG